jgi:hypothetical protein
VSFREKLKIPSNKDFGYYELKKLKNNYPEVNIDNFCTELTSVLDSGIYNSLFEAYIGWEEPVKLTDDDTTDIAIESPILVLASKNLTNKPSKFSPDLINYSTFYFFLPFLEWVYSLYLGRTLNSKDVKILFKSHIAEKIALNLLNFDKVENSDEINMEFFIKLKKINWKDNRTKEFYKKTKKLIGFFAFEKHGDNEYSFIVRQKRIILFLAACSAVKNGESVITIDDIILAYKTLFKIIKTDISKLI